MIVLQLPPHKQAFLEQQSQQAGVSIEQYIISKIIPDDGASEKPFENNISKLKGIVKTDIKLSIEEMNAAIAQAGAESAK